MDLKQKKLSNIFRLPKDEALKEFYDRMITIPTTARTSLKKELLSMIGQDRAKGVFIRYGWHCGVSDAKKVESYETKDELELILGGAKFHMLHGYVDEVQVSNICYNETNQLEKIDVKWINSFEADEHLVDGSLSMQPVCHTLGGYASGYLSTVLQRPILVKEVECRAMGHEQCRVICKPLENWGQDEQEHEHNYYQSTSMIQELDEITAKLKIERDYLKQANEIQQKLTQQLLAKQGLHNIVNLIYDTVGLPIFIENNSNTIIAKSPNAQIDFSLEFTDSTSTEFIKISPEIGLLRTPVYFEDEIKGYCSFIYENGNKPTDLEYMIINKTSLTASIILLNENIKVSAEQNIKRSFLSDVLDEKIEQDEIYKIAYYLDFPPTSKYWLLALETMINQSCINKKIKINEEFIKQINIFLSERNIAALVCQKADNIIVLIEYTSFQALNMEPQKFIDLLLKYCTRRFEKHRFYIGVSTVLEDLSQISILYNEALAALKAKNPNKRVYYFEDLEIEGVIFQIKDELLIDRFVEQQLGKLLDVDKDYDLTKTIYTYIENGININNTAKALSMSISGLRYRLSKISDILNIRLDDTKRLFSVYMALKVLKVKNQISF